MRWKAIILSTLLAATLPAFAQEPGRMVGGQVYTLPSWFRTSFLDFRQDSEEARRAGRHVLAFLHLDECPYCARMLAESFTSGEMRDFIEQHFDVIAVNVRGTLEVAWIDGRTYTERELARRLEAFATPTLVFLGMDGTKVLQLMGYRDPRALRTALEYVKSRSYVEQPFAGYAAQRDLPAVYTPRPHPQFSPLRDLSGYRKPLAILFEDRRCAACARFHETTLGRDDVKEELGRFLVVRLVTDSDEPIVDPDGNATTPARWAASLGLTYRPALALFDEGRRVHSIDGGLYHFHFREALRYVSGGHYKRYATISGYNAARRAELLREGKTIDYGE